VRIAMIAAVVSLSAILFFIQMPPLFRWTDGNYNAAAKAG